MTAQNPTVAETFDIAAWSDDDASVPETSYLSGLTNGNTTTEVFRVGSAPDDVLRIQFPGRRTIRPGDTVTVWVSALSTFATMALLAYTANRVVTTTDKITLTAATGANTFTLTQAFINQLVHIGAGQWAARVVEDGGLSGYAGIAEIDSDLTLSGSGGSPGSTPGNAPAGYTYIKNRRLTNTPITSKMPTSQKEWNGFIQELQKWLKNETGTFDISSTDDAKFTGFSADPATSSIWYHRFGQMVHLEFNIGVGTSNATGFSITGIPESIRPRDDCVYPIYGLYDNGAVIADRGSVKVGADGTLTFYTDHSDGAWTNSGNKGFETGKGVKGLIYSLRSPEKL